MKSVLDCIKQINFTFIMEISWYKIQVPNQIRELLHLISAEEVSIVDGVEDGKVLFNLICFFGWLAISLFCVKKYFYFPIQLHRICVCYLFVCYFVAHSDSVAAVVIMTVSFLHLFSFHLVAQIIANCLFHAYCLLDSDSNLFHRLVPDESTMHWCSPLSSPFQWHCQFFFFQPFT